MNFSDTPDEAAFRKAACDWLRANASTPEEARLRSPEASNAEQSLMAAKQWQAKKADAGWGCPIWPREYGGMSAPPIHQAIWIDEEEKYSVSPGIGLINYFDVAFAVCAPAILAHGTKGQKDRYLPPMLRADEVWCQLFSEPSAGSDLAAIATRAERDGSSWIINGGKIWTSLGHIADFGVLIARSDPAAPRHRGLTFFVLDMKAPGVKVTPIRQMTGASGFNQVLFDNVRISDDCRIGEVNEGWQVAMTALSSERLAVGDSRPPGFEELFALASAITIDGVPAIAKEDVRQKLAEWYVASRGLRYMKFRMLTALSKGRLPGAEVAMTKLVSAPMVQDIGCFGMDLMEQCGMLADPGDLPEASLFQKAYLFSPGKRIASGTDEILRNIIAERVLGLPQETRLDKGPPFVSPKANDQQP